MAETFTNDLELSKFAQGQRPPILSATKLNENWTKLDKANIGHGEEFPETYYADKLFLRTDAGVFYENTGTLEIPVWSEVLISGDGLDLQNLEGDTDDEILIGMGVDGDAQKRFTITADGSMSWGSGSAAPTVSLEHKSTTSGNGLVGGPHENLRFTLPENPHTYQDYFSFYDQGATRASVRVSQRGDFWVHANHYSVWTGPGNPDISGGHIIGTVGHTFASCWQFQLATIDGWEFAHDNSTATPGVLIEAMRIPNFKDQSQIFLNGQVFIGNQAVSSGLWTTVNIQAAEHSGLTAGAENKDVYFDLSRPVTWATGALALQRFMFIDAPTVQFSGASTCSKAITVAIDGAPLAGTNATITTPVALHIGDYALSVVPQDGIQLNRAGDSSRNWICWTQGSTVVDWRTGATVNAGSYDLSFFSGNAGGATTPANPGTEVFRITQGGKVCIG